MSSTNLGRVGIVPRGEYNSSTTYERLDVVTYQTKSYMAVTTSQGITPSEDRPEWQLLVAVPDYGPPKDGVATSFYVNPISAGTDLDTITTPGIYGCGMDVDARTLINCPVTAAFSMIVISKDTKDQGLASQILITYSGGNTRKFYCRSIRPSTNQAIWTKIYTEFDPLVFSVNNVSPDSSGNVSIDIPQYAGFTNYLSSANSYSVEGELTQASGSWMSWNSFAFSKKVLDALKMHKTNKEKISYVLSGDIKLLRGSIIELSARLQQYANSSWATIYPTTVYPFASSETISADYKHFVIRGTIDLTRINDPTSFRVLLSSNANEDFAVMFRHCQFQFGSLESEWRPSIDDESQTVAIDE